MLAGEVLRKDLSELPQKLLNSTFAGVADGCWRAQGLRSSLLLSKACEGLEGRGRSEAGSSVHRHASARKSGGKPPALQTLREEVG